MPETEPTSTEIALRLKEALIRGVIWGFVGILYGSLFVTLEQITPQLTPLPFAPILLAGTLAAGMGALIYGSMRLAVIIAAASLVVAVSSLVIVGEFANPVALILGTSLIGALIGALYGALAHTSRVHRADAKTITGLVSGIFVSSLFVLVCRLTEQQPGVGWTVAVMCPLTGLVYTRLVEWFIDHFEDLLPPVGDGAMVGAGAAFYIGGGLWLVAGYIDPAAFGSHATMAAPILERLPAAIGGGLIGGMLGGVASGMLGMRWQDL